MPNPNDTTPFSSSGTPVFAGERGPSAVQIALAGDAAVPEPATTPADEEPHVIGTLRPSGPTDLRRVDTLEELSTMADGTVVVWHDSYSGRQAGVLVTGLRGDREIQPVSLTIYESNTDLCLVTPPVWVLTFNDPET